MGMQREGQFKYELRVFRANFTLCPCAKFQPGCASHKVQSSSFISLASFFLARYRESVFWNDQVCPSSHTLHRKSGKRSSKKLYRSSRKVPRTGERSWLRHVSSHVKYKEREKFREFSRIGRPNFLTGSLGNEFWEISLYIRFSVVPFPVITSLGRFGLIILCQRDFFLLQDVFHSL